MNCRALACCFGTVLMLAPSGLNGQAVSGSITGIVTDPSGAAVSNAAVSVENTGTSLLTRTTTTNSGFYTVTNLIPGEYTVRVEAPGFRQFLTTGIRLSVDTGVRVDAHWRLATRQRPSTSPPNPHCSRPKKPT